MADRRFTLGDAEPDTDAQAAPQKPTPEQKAARGAAITALANEMMDRCKLAFEAGADPDMIIKAACLLLLHVCIPAEVGFAQLAPVLMQSFAAHQAEQEITDRKKLIITG